MSPTDLEQAQLDALSQMRDVLRGEFQQLHVTRYSVTEDFDAGRSHVECDVQLNDGAPVTVAGDGVGMIDALFNALKSRFAPEYPSLESIRFSGLFVKGLMTDAKAQHGADASAEARVHITNSYGREFTFRSVTGSVSRSSVEAVIAGAEYFINAERAYITMYNALQHYRSEGRVDLVDKYTARLSDMVRNTSYSAALERLQAE